MKKMIVIIVGCIILSPIIILTVLFTYKIPYHNMIARNNLNWLLSAPRPKETIIFDSHKGVGSYFSGGHPRLCIRRGCAIVSIVVFASKESQEEVEKYYMKLYRKLSPDSLTKIMYPDFYALNNDGAYLWPLEEQFCRNYKLDNIRIIPAAITAEYPTLYMMMTYDIGTESGDFRCED